ncbi:hypothetical protein KIW84_014901 [Lathyrus oleraceus]|uniref:Uncharacterized protein n=1 Tax=Pisum sativum TaxID=3888 RepID=A0A9D5GZN0_PEA|nr:hypothetical protein KIW84_014901 [Pisum sativum]
MEKGKTMNNINKRNPVKKAWTTNNDDHELLGFAGIWSHFVIRFGLLSVLPKDIVDHLYQFEVFIDSGRNAVSGARVVMFARIWVAMNNNLFRTKAVPVELCFAAVKR